MGQGLEPSTADLFLFSRSQPPQLPSRTDFFERSKKQAHTRDNNSSISSSERSVASDRNEPNGVRFALTGCSNSHCLAGTCTQSGAAVHHAQGRWPQLLAYHRTTNYLLQYISAIGVRWMSFV
uniref:Uncharacterized protein n=1 Tax=Anopheles maculatus TaxID=74869 RepID=A0A182SQ89_9DIPT